MRAAWSKAIPVDSTAAAFAKMLPRDQPAAAGAPMLAKLFKSKLGVSGTGLVLAGLAEARLRGC